MSWLLYCHEIHQETGWAESEEDEVFRTFCAVGQLFPAELEEAQRLNAASHKRRQRLRKTILALILGGSAVFVTLTFNDKFLASNNPLSRRRYVSHMLRSTGEAYVANVDYGAVNGREHYHAIVARDHPALYDSRAGFTCIKPIEVSRASLERLPKYLDKLTNHAMKATTKASRIIYGRAVRPDCITAGQYQEALERLLAIDPEPEEPAEPEPSDGAVPSVGRPGGGVPSGGPTAGKGPGSSSPRT